MELQCAGIMLAMRKNRRDRIRTRILLLSARGRHLPDPASGIRIFC